MKNIKITDVSPEKEELKDVSTYNPSKEKYDVKRDVVWKRGEKVPYLAFSRTLEEIERVSSRLKMIEILSNYLSSVMILSPEDAAPSVYLCLNKLAPDYEGLELGVGESLILKALAEATGRKVAQLKSEVEKKGDLGLVAESSRTTQRTIFSAPKLTIDMVYKRLKEVAQMSGQSSAGHKVAKIKSLIVSCRDVEARYLVRSLTGKLRVGLAEQSLLVALGQAATLHEDPERKRGTEAFKKRSETAVQMLKVAFCECPNYDMIIDVILKQGVDALPENCKITPGIPLKPMLAHPSKGVEEVLRRFENNSFTCEYKYDGERAQIHMTEAGTISVFSRNQENTTSKYPDIISCMPQVLADGVRSFIIDSEAVAWDRENQKILPFQVLATRKRKDVKEQDIKVQVCLFSFDILYLNGEPLVRKTLRERRKLLQESFIKSEGRFHLAQGRDVSTTDEIQELIDEAVKGSFSRCPFDILIFHVLFSRQTDARVSWLNLWIQMPLMKYPKGLTTG